MANKIFWVDTETGGIDPNKDGLIEIAYIIEIDYEVKEKGSILMNPYLLNKKVEAQALEVNKLEKKTIEMYPNPFEAFSALKLILNKYIDPYNSKDKFIPAGYNVRFDIDFIKQYFLDMGDNFYGSYFSHHFIDVFSLIFSLTYLKLFPELNNYKLENIAYVFGYTSEEFHSGEEDIRITREVFLKVQEMLKLSTN